MVSESLLDFAVGLDDDVDERIVLRPLGRLKSRLRCRCTARRASLFVDHASTTLYEATGGKLSSHKSVAKQNGKFLHAYG